MRALSLSRLTSRERHVIGLLREADPAVAKGALTAPFRTLREALARIGYRAGSGAGIYATRQELCLLGVLAALQRDQADVTIRLDASLRPIAHDCARALVREDMYLRHAALARLGGYVETCRELLIDLVAVRSPVQRRTAIRLPTPGTSQAMALRFVQERGATATRDFIEHGVSRQTISMMHKHGVLERVRYGVYCAAPETMRG